MNATVLWVIAAILVIVGIVQLIQGQILFGIILIVLGCLVGPGGTACSAAAEPDPERHCRTAPARGRSLHVGSAPVDQVMLVVGLGTAGHDRGKCLVDGRVEVVAVEGPEQPVPRRAGPGAGSAARRTRGGSRLRSARGRAARASRPR